MHRRAERKVTWLAALFLAVAGQPSAAELVGDFNWQPGAGQGGFSALHVMPGGTDFVALSDHGFWVTGQFQRDAAGRIDGVSTAYAITLRGVRGQPLSRAQSDSEGLAILPDGRVFVSFEGPARVLAYDTLGDKARFVPVAGDFRKMDHNTALEAVAATPDGTVYTIPETSDSETEFPVYRLKGKVWDQPFTIPRSDGFLVSDATIGPDGRLYVLERKLVPLAGFASRLRRFTLTDQALTGDEVMFQTTLGVHGNLEGVSVWRDAEGHLRATLISDDNYLTLLRNDIAEYRLPD